MVHKSDSSVRIANTSDIPHIMHLCKEGLSEVGIDYNEKYLFKKIVNSYHLAPCFLYEKDGNIEGLAGFTIAINAYNGKAIMSEYIFYIRDKHRNIESLRGLVDAAKDFALDNSMDLRVEFIVVDDLQKRKRLLEHFGFKVTGLVGVVEWDQKAAVA